MTQHQLGNIINRMTGVRAELKAMEAQARHLAAECRETEQHIQATQTALVEQFMERGDLSAQSSTDIHHDEQTSDPK